MRSLLAVDQSKHSETAIQFLGTQEFVVPVDLELISVLPPLPYIGVAGSEMSAGMMPDIGRLTVDEEAFLQRRLEKTASDLKGRFRSVKSSVKIGSPAGEIEALSESIHADLVVMGALGHSAIVRTFLGSVSDHVATHVRGSALVVRPQNDQALKLQRVLLAVGASQRDELLVKRIGMFDLSESVEVHLVHVMERITFFHHDVLNRQSDIWQQTRTAAAEHTEALADRVRKAGFKTTTEVLEEEHTGEALVNYANKNECDLTVTCDRRRSLLDRAIIGSTSRYVLRHSKGSVLIARPDRNDQSSNAEQA